MSDDKLESKLIAAYDKMVDRLHQFFDSAEDHASTTIEKNLDKAKQQAVDLKELSQEESEKIATYVKRDISDLASHISETSQDVSNWFSFDIQLIEERILESFAKVADKTRLELTNLSNQAQRAQHYKTGEISCIGTLVCTNCDTEMHFKKTSRIPPCPKCHKTQFKRRWKK